MINFQLPTLRVSSPVSLPPATAVIPSVAATTYHLLDRAGTLVRQGAVISADPNASVGAFVTFGEVKFHITGTGSDGRYIGQSAVGTGGLPPRGAVEPPRLYLTNIGAVINLLQLARVAGEQNEFTRAGFSGKYHLQREEDGSLSVFYPGGEHQNNGSVVRLPEQTFHHGRWDVSRNVARASVQAAEATESSRELNRVRTTTVARHMATYNQSDGSHVLASDAKDTEGGGTGYYTPTSTQSLHQPVGTDPDWRSGTPPSGSSGTPLLRETLELPVSDTSDWRERRLTSIPVSYRPPLSGPSSSSGAPPTIYVFCPAILHPVTYVIADKPRIMPSEVRDAYQAATESDGTLTTDVWLRLTENRRAMVRIDGSVLFENTRGSDNTVSYVRTRPRWARPAASETRTDRKNLLLEWSDTAMRWDAGRNDFVPVVEEGV